LCPVCKSKTRVRIRDDKILQNFPLYCLKYKRETLITIISLQIIVIKEPGAKNREKTYGIFTVSSMGNSIFTPPILSNQRCIEMDFASFSR